jgi:hypothetical protein
MDALAQRYGVLPSTLAGLSIEDFCLNLLIASVGIEREAKAAEKARKEADKWHRKKRPSY